MSCDRIVDGSTFDRQTVLLVEDNEDDVLIMQSAFRKAGVINPLRNVGDGEEAIAYLRGDGKYGDRATHPLPVIILLDLNMPRKSGLEVLQWIREQPGLRRIAVHILTSSIRQTDVERAFDLGANFYIVKPSKVEALVEMLRSWQSLAKFAAHPIASPIQTDVAATAAQSSSVHPTASGGDPGDGFAQIKPADLVA